MDLSIIYYSKQNTLMNRMYYCIQVKGTQGAEVKKGGEVHSRTVHGRLMGE
jgi:hypothetical protein